MNKLCQWLVITVLSIYAASGYATETAIILSNANADLLKGTWVGTWNASWGGTGPYELKITNVEVRKVTGQRSQPSQRGGTTSTNGKIDEAGQLVLDIDKGQNRLIELQLYIDDSRKEMWLRGSYSTTGRYYDTGKPGVFTGTLDLKKQ